MSEASKEPKDRKAREVRASSSAEGSVAASEVESITGADAFRLRPLTMSDVDAVLALERAWRDLALAERPRPAVEAPLVEPGALQRLADDLDECRDLARGGVLAAFHDGLRAALQGAHGLPLRRLEAEAGLAHALGWMRGRRNVPPPVSTRPRPPPTAAASAC